MAIFSSQGGNAEKEIETIIGASVKVEGNFKSEGNITVNGIVEGSLKTNKDLTIGQGARVKAEVSAQNLILQGEIRGNVAIKQKTQLSSTAKIIGNLETKTLAVEEGAIINGKCLMIADQQSDEGKLENKKPAK